jgi:hypothetical protein
MENLMYHHPLMAIYLLCAAALWIGFFWDCWRNTSRTRDSSRSMQAAPPRVEK